MDNSNKEQLENILADLKEIKNVDEDQKQTRLISLIQKTRTIFGNACPHLAIMQFQYASLIFNYIETEYQDCNPDNIRCFQENKIEANQEEQQKDDSLEDQNGANNQVSGNQQAFQNEKTKLQNEGFSGVQKTENHSNKNSQQKQDEIIVYQDNCIQITETDDKIKKQLSKEPEFIVQLESDSEEDYDLTDIEICYENFQAALKIYDRELKKIEDGKESSLDLKEAQKYKFHIHVLLGKLYSMDQKYDESIQEFRTSVRLASDYDHPETHRVISEAHFGVGSALLQQKNSGCEELAIEQYISAVVCLINYLGKVERCDTQKFEVPSLQNPRVDRYQYLPAPKDSKIVSEMKEVISMILDKIEDTNERIKRRDVYEAKIRESDKNDKDEKEMEMENKELQFNVFLKEQNLKGLVTFGDRKRPPQDVSFDQQAQARILKGLNPGAPRLQMLNLRNSSKEQDKESQTVKNPFLVSSIQPVFSPQFNYYASMTNELLQIRDASSPFMTEALTKIDLRKQGVKGVASSESSTKVIFSPDERMFAVMKGNYICVYSMKGELMAQISDHLMEEIPQINSKKNDDQFRYDIKDFFWCQNKPFYQLVVLYDKAEYYKIYNIKSGQVLVINHCCTKAEKVCAFGRDGKLFAVLGFENDTKTQHETDCVYLYSANDGNWNCGQKCAIGSSFVDLIELTVDGSLILFDDPRHLKMYFLEPKSSQVRTLLCDETSSLSAYEMSESGKFLAVGTNLGKVFVFQTNDMSQQRQIQLVPIVHLSQQIVLVREQHDMFQIQNFDTYQLKWQNEDMRTINDSPRLYLRITKMKFSPNDDLLALRSRDMPYYVFIYDLTGQRTVIIETTAKVTDFDWLHSNDDQPHTLCIISEDHTSFRIWKDTCLEGFSFKQIISTNSKNQLKFTHLQSGKNNAFILYAKEQKKFVFACYSPEPSHQSHVYEI